MFHLISPWHTRNTAPCGAPRYQGGAPRATCLVFPLILFFISAATSADTLSGQVIRVSDGDTITVLDAEKQIHKIRLAGIDAPEKKQPFGERSKQALAALVFQKSVRVEWRKLDRYRRLIGQVWVTPPESRCFGEHCAKTSDASLAQVKAGMAWHYKKYEKEQSADDRLRYASAEEQARTEQLGLWSDAHPIPPWEWRKP